MFQGKIPSGVTVTLKSLCIYLIMLQRLTTRLNIPSLNFWIPLWTLSLCISLLSLINSFATKSLSRKWFKSFLLRVFFFFNLELRQNEKILPKLSSNTGSFSGMIMFIKYSLRVILKYALKIFRKTNISKPLIRTRTLEMLVFRKTLSTYSMDDPLPCYNRKS